MRLLDPVRRPLLELGYQLGGWPRRVAALLCLVLAVVTTIDGRERAAVAPRAPVVVAARDLAAGTVLHTGDLELAHWTSADIPPRALTALRAAVGSSIAAGVDQGEPLTTARIRGPGVTVGLPPGFVAVTVTISGPSALTLIRAGDAVDLLATTAPEAGGWGTPESWRLQCAFLPSFRLGPTGPTGRAQPWSWPLSAPPLSRSHPWSTVR